MTVLVLTSVTSATACGEGDGDSSAGTGGTQNTALGGTEGQNGESGGASAATGGQSSGGGSSSTGGAGTSPTGPTGSCPVWPPERFFPEIGVYFYGTNPMPCTRTRTAVGSASSTLDGTFDLAYDDAGYVVTMTNRDSGLAFTYTREEKRVVSSVGTNSTGVTTYLYGTNSAGYELTYDSTLLSRVEYALDARGYPLSVGTSYESSGALPAVHYVYEYDGCRIKQRTAYLGDGTVDSSDTQTYEYDAEGRLVTVRSGHFTDTFDHACP
jgi:hypothetical protein